MSTRFCCFIHKNVAMTNLFPIVIVPKIFVATLMTLHDVCTSTTQTPVIFFPSSEGVTLLRICVVGALASPGSK